MKQHRTQFAVLLAVALSSVAFATNNSPGTINLDLVERFTIDAVSRVFQAAERTYALDPELSNQDLSKHVSLALHNATPDDAITSLLRATGLTYRMDGNVYFITKKKPGEPDFPSVMQQPASQMISQDVVTMPVPAMPIRDALETVLPTPQGQQPKWKMDDQIGHTTMSGARFYKFPREMAGMILLTAVGLLPPSNPNNPIAKKGKIDLPVALQWTPRLSAQSSDYGGYQTSFGGYPGPSGGGNYGTQSGSPTSADRGDMALAAYKSGNEWLLVILVSQMPDIDVLQQLLTLSGKSFLIPDLSNRPGPKSVQIVGEKVITYPSPSPTKFVTAQFYGVTLDQALEILLPPLDLKYKKIGPLDNPTYVIEPVSSTVAAKPAVPRKSTKPVTNR